jgi:t-SNARE complex subunit (syntaxin)
MRNQDLIKILTEINDQQRDQTKINSMLMDRLDLFSRTILMVLETQNRMIEVIPEWIERAEKGNPLSDSELKDINKYTEQLLKKAN